MSQFNHQLKLSIVKGIVAGYKEYVEVRNEAHKKLKVSMGMHLLKRIILITTLRFIPRILWKIQDVVQDLHGSFYYLARPTNITKRFFIL
ncbi:hypothetical protein RNS46_07100 [Staphylococcus pseudintermedius]|uniref:hypothetical protein n=1 Tax=Staphylococcus pseudintermedius TaxID=283734 RepID=UPI000F7BB7A7|nr:hypothetical protein [Staphylococcus pseudintermedius]MDF0047165.1 hypothetical protein [Staphylococcus pseudintermedius]MDF0352677.1 hypothetical protein [Staphylococcus pseudintermedius]MDF0362062.1 hypothetical protein [Staphylococcus pseudintermedius]MDT0927583.1 hypothetical protein [Staphylococcus pseudintermedius]BBH72920.1 hypothetical protein GSP_01140 [Staphylococcus pseudintermedius]